MPELPEVETVRRQLAPVLEGARLSFVKTNRANLRYPFPLNLRHRLQGRHISRISRRAKYLLIVLDDDTVMISHLGMSGSWRIEETEEVAAESLHLTKSSRHDHLTLDMVREGRVIRAIYNDPRRFGFILLSNMTEIDNHPMLKNLGVEPLGNALCAPYLFQRLRHKKTSLKAALLDQRLIAGLGNIYVCEALWRARFSPWLATNQLVCDTTSAQKALLRLVSAIRAVLMEALEAGGSTLRDYAHIDGSSGYFQHAFDVYGREGLPCRMCTTPILRTLQAGRSTFYCPTCQSPDKI